MERIVIVGASLAGARAAQALRTHGFAGSLTMVGAEPHLPYDRPPLSKEVLVGEADQASAFLHGAEHWDDLGVELLLGNAARRLCPQTRTVELADRVLAYDGLIIATGAHPRLLPAGHDIAGVHVLRTLDDAAALRDAMARRPRVFVVGAGFIGAEAASAARRHGCDVTVTEALPAPLTRGLGPLVGEACGRLHADHGTALRVGVGVESIEADGSGGVAAVRLADGTVVETDLVLVGIGAIPTTEWLTGSGLTLRDGLVCDATLSAGPPGVYAAGDCARWPNPWAGTEMRLEHWSNAAEQGAAAAANLLAGPDGATPFSSVPYVWSDQYGTRIQVAGHVGPDDVAEILLGSVEERSFLVAYRRGERFVAVAALGLIRPFVKLRIVLSQGGSWDDAVATASSLR